MKQIKSIKISDQCVGCGMCQSTCPDVFQVDSVSEVKKDANFSENLDCIEEAEQACPVGAIEIEWDT